MKKKLFFLAAMTAVASANAQEKIMVDGHEAVDLGLSVLWATCNIGADSPEEIGDYFAWGEIEPKSDYTETNYLFNEKPEELDADHDAATQKWGKNWRMPTYKEIQELETLKLIVETNGWSLKGNGNSIFIPATGIKMDNEWVNSTFGYFSSKTIYYTWSNRGCRISSSTNTIYVHAVFAFYSGVPVRPVCEKSVVTKLNFVEKDNANTVYKTIENGQIVIVKNGVKYNLRGQKL